MISTKGDFFSYIVFTTSTDVLQKERHKEDTRIAALQNLHTKLYSSNFCLIPTSQSVDLPLHELTNPLAEKKSFNSILLNCPILVFLRKLKKMPND